MIKKVMSFLVKYWFPIFLVGVLIFILIQQQFDSNKYKKQIREHEKRIKDLQEQVAKDLKLIEELKDQDTIYIDSIRVIKQKRDEKIKLVDTMSVSTMQQFFSDRYSVNE